jgi:protein SCO1/2
MRATVEAGFKIAMGREDTRDDRRVIDPAQVFHGTHFVLIDQEMRIRGYYDLSDAGGEDRLVRDAGLLANRAHDGRR